MKSVKKDKIMNWLPVLNGLKEDDRSSFAQIVHHFTAELNIQAYRFTKNTADAEDLVQDIFTDLWQKRTQLNITISLRSYLYSCLKHKFLRKISRANLNSNALAYLGQHLEQMESTVSELLEASEIQLTVSEVLSSLPEHMQRIFMLRDEDYSIREIADVLGLAEQTVKTYNMQLKRRIKAAILERHPDLSHSLQLIILTDIFVHYFF